MPSRFAAVVLAGGASRRMGRDKAVVDVGGRPMLERVADAVTEAGADPVVIGGGPLRHGRLDVLPDRRPGSGPLAAIADALVWSPHELVVVLACDLALLDTETVTRLVAAAAEPAIDVATAVTDRREPLCAAWRVSACLPVVEELVIAGERAVVAAFDRLRVGEVPVSAERLLNVNTPADLARARRADPQHR